MKRQSTPISQATALYAPYALSLYILYIYLLWGGGFFVASLAGGAAVFVAPRGRCARFMGGQGKRALSVKGAKGAWWGIWGCSSCGGCGG